MHRIGTYSSSLQWRDCFALIAILCTLAVCLVIAGCGGGGGGGGSSTPTAVPATVTIDWPTRSRSANAPASALSAVLTFVHGSSSNTDVVLTCDRGSTAGAFSQSYTTTTPVRVGEQSVGIQFFAGPDGTGTVVASGLPGFTVPASGKVTDALTTYPFMAVQSVAVAPNQSVSYGQRHDIAFSAYAADSTIVVLTPGSATYTVTSGSDKLSIVGGQLVGLAPGVAMITATVDGITSSEQTVTVLPVVQSVSVTSPPTLSIGDNGVLSASAVDTTGAPVDLTAFATYLPVTYSVVAGNGLIQVTGNIVTALASGTATVKATIGGVDSPESTITVLPPLKVLIEGNAQSGPIVQLNQQLTSRHYAVTVDSDDSVIWDGYDVVVFDESARVGPVNADHVRTLLQAGKTGIVLLGRAPELLANGKLSTALSTDISSIGDWFAGATNMNYFSGSPALYVPLSAVAFPLPSSFTPGGQVYTVDAPAASFYTNALGSSSAVSRILSLSPKVDNPSIYSFAYQTAGSGRVYWQFNALGDNQQFGSNLADLFSAGMQWTAHR